MTTVKESPVLLDLFCGEGGASTDDARAAMGIDWMGMKGLSQAIPPAYTYFIGQQLILQIGASPC